MKISKHEGGEERQVLIGMVVDRVVLSQVSAAWTKGGLFRSRWANLVGGWCVDHFTGYDEPPAGTLESVFASWAESKRRREEDVELVDRFLSSLSDEHERLAEEVNPEYLIDLAGRHFKRVALERLSQEITGDLELDDEDAAEARVSAFERPELGVGAGIDVFRDQEALRAAFEEQAEPLIEWPDPFDRFFGSAFERDSFISFLAPEKRGKTWALLEVAWRAARQRRRTAFFAVGDMSQGQIELRLAVRAAKHPARGKEWPLTVWLPKSLEMEEGEDGRREPQVEHEPVEFDKPLSWQRAWKAYERLTKGRSGSYLKLSVHPNSSIGVEGISAIISGWERKGWVPDVIVIDYADNLEPPRGQGNGDFRHATNATWKALRRLSQELHCCLVTATQADAASYERKTVGKSNFSEDKRKLAHVTGMVGINQTPDEKKRGLTRLNWVARREEEFHEYQCLTVAGCLALSRPWMIGCF